MKTIEKIDIPSQTLNKKELPEIYGEFRELPINYSNLKLRLLLGLSHSLYRFDNNAEEMHG